MNQKEILKLLYDRDESALKKIQDEYGNLIKSVAFNVFRSDSIAEECLNDTLMDIWDTIPPEEPKSIMSYACMIVRRRAVDRIRQETAKKRARPEGSGFIDAMEEITYLDDIAEEVVDKIELSRVISEFLRKQSGTNREVFISRYYDFESLDSIAARLHLSKNSVNTRLTRMRNSLKAKLEEGGVSI